MFTITVDEDITLHLLQEHHYHDLFALIDKNRAYLEPTMGRDLDTTSEITRESCLLAKKRFAEKGSIFALITYKGQSAGMISLQDRTGQSLGGAEIGYWLGEEFTGNGIITRATKTLTDYAFSHWDVQRVFLGIATDNQPSIAVAERLNFTLEGTLRQNDKTDDKWIDRHIYSVIKDEWQLPQNPPILRYQLDDKLDMRLIEKRHAQELFDVCDNNREHIKEFLPWLTDSYNLNDSHQFIEASLTQYGNNDGWQASIWHDNQLIGMIGYLFWDFHSQQTEIGYWLAKSVTGQGIMTRCARELTRYAFETLHLNRTVIRCADENTKSAGVAERLGYTLEGKIRHGGNLHGKFVDLRVYSLLAEEWHTQ